MMKKVIRLQGISLLLLILTSVITVSALGYYLSNIYQHSVTVSEAKLMTISPDASTPLLDNTITGQAFNVTVNVDNPNPVALKGRILISFTKTGITTDSVAVTSTCSNPPTYYILAIIKTLDQDTLNFKIYPNSQEPYFTFQPGTNAAIVWFTVIYQAAGTYAINLAVVAT